MYLKLYLNVIILAEKIYNYDNNYNNNCNNNNCNNNNIKKKLQ